MKIDPAFSLVSRALANPGVARGVSSRFTLPPIEDAQASAGPARARAVGGAGLVAALAGEVDREARRQRRQSHAAGLLGGLEMLMRALSLGYVDSKTLDGLAQTLDDSGSASDDPALEGLIEAIELRAAVELAKLKAQKPRI